MQDFPSSFMEFAGSHGLSLPGMEAPASPAPGGNTANSGSGSSPASAPSSARRRRKDSVLGADQDANTYSTQPTGV